MVVYRIRWKDLALLECNGSVCRRSRVRFDSARKVAELFLKNGKLGLIRDGDFLKGGFRDGKCVGKRIDVLPDGTRLAKGFPLFGKNLRVHDERSHGHWDVIFENVSGGFSYVYSLEKMKISKERKFRMVDEFERCLPVLKRNLLAELRRVRVARGKGEGGCDGDLVLAMLVLLATKMRVGCEVYYKRNRHKGLTTLKKKNIKISKGAVTFDFVGKDGVPQVLTEKFEGVLLDELKDVLSRRKKDEFVFLSSRGGILRDTDFEAGFERFCGRKFYPHIVRSHFATREVEKFLEKRKGDAREFCLGLADKLGHKRFSKKEGKWKDNFEVTLHSYVRGDLVDRLWVDE